MTKATVATATYTTTEELANVLRAAVHKRSAYMAGKPRHRMTRGQYRIYRAGLAPLQTRVENLREQAREAGIAVEDREPAGPVMCPWECRRMTEHELVRDYVAGSRWYVCQECGDRRSV